MIAFVYPGQGSQVTGMGADLCAGLPAADAVFAAAEATLNLSLRRLCFEGPDEALRPTEIAQPALLTASLACWEAVRQHGVEPAFVAGHSLGEYTALVAAEALTLEDAVRLVRRRGELMRDAAESCPGTMLAVLRLDDERVAELCERIDGVVQPANYNAPGQVVVSGEVAACAALAEAVKAAGGRAMPLAVSGAFHSALMQPAAEALAAELAQTTLRTARVPVIQNVTATPETAPEALRANLAAQVTGSVRWADTVRRLSAEGVQRVVEIGPGAVLSGLIKRIAPEILVYNVSDTATAAGLVAWLDSEVGS